MVFFFALLAFKKPVRPPPPNADFGEAVVLMFLLLALLLGAEA